MITGFEVQPGDFPELRRKGKGGTIHVNPSSISCMNSGTLIIGAVHCGSVSIGFGMWSLCWIK